MATTSSMDLVALVREHLEEAHPVTSTDVVY
jgi:hypothetical protein